MDKVTLRRAMLERRAALSPETVAQNSSLILSQLRTLLAEKERIMVYLSFGNEVDTFPLLQWLWQKGKQVAVPVCDTQTCEIYPSVLTTMEELAPNRYGILEPTAICTPDFSYDAVVVPGVTFDLNGNRIGFGKGYYDKFLQSAGQTLKIGVCHDFQLLAHIPSEPHDVCMNLVITENRMVLI